MKSYSQNVAKKPHLFAYLKETLCVYTYKKIKCHKRLSIFKRYHLESEMALISFECVSEISIYKNKQKHRIPVFVAHSVYL